MNDSICEAFDWITGFSCGDSSNSSQGNGQVAEEICTVIEFEGCEDIAMDGIPGMGGGEMGIPPQEGGSTSPVPEPGAALLFGAGLLVAAVWGKKRIS